VQSEVCAPSATLHRHLYVHQASVKALLRLYSGSIRPLLRLYKGGDLQVHDIGLEGKAVLRLY
jgi:hypothetical protein